MSHKSKLENNISPNCLPNNDHLEAKSAIWGSGDIWWNPRAWPSTCFLTGFDPWVGKAPWRRERLPTPVFWPGEFHGLYSPWGRKDSDKTDFQLLFKHLTLTGMRK